jgi:tetratricopeptide (TPR) repeat protein/transcriptional regulator with XRE-family HTH domain
VAEQPATLAGLLRKLRVDAGLTQEELAEAAGLSARSISDLERGINQTARKDTARLLADALNLTGSTRAEFEAIARGRPLASADSPGDTAAGPRGVAAATRTLPRDISSFEGRERELRELVDTAMGASGGLVGIHAIGGMAGIGKTAFAVRAAHQLAARFPDGQIFLSLHGHTPGQRPVSPADALASLLLTAGIPVRQIPPGLEARMALWRDRLAGRQLLLVLDDAADSDQVRPLLPGIGGSLVLVTSRRHLSALEDARAISLDTLAPDEAARLLVRLAARPELGTDDAAVGEIAHLCGYLPLAIGMLARQLHHHPAWSPADLLADLAAGHDRLEVMQAENLSVTAAFNLSYEDLADAQKRLFRRLGLHPGTDIDGYAAAALNDVDLVTARRHLEALYDHYLLTEPARGRYRLHDLIREHANAHAVRDDPAADREQAAGRLLDYYQYTAEQADRLITRYTRSGRVTVTAPPTAVPDLADRTRTLTWVRAERANLLAHLDRVTSARQHARVVALTAAMAALLRHDGPWTEAITRHGTAVQAARHLADRPGEADALTDLGVVQQMSGDYPGAAQSLGEALVIARELGDRRAEANALSSLGIVRRQSGDYPGATDDLQAALVIFRDLDDRLGEGSALTDLGVVQCLIGDFTGASGTLDAGLAISREIGDGQGQATALRFLAAIRRQTGDYPGAASALEEALAISRDLGDRLGEAVALLYLAEVRRMTGNYPGAASALEEALAISRDLGDRLSEANALDILGIVRRQTGDYPAAAATLHMALDLYREIGNRKGEANALKDLGVVLCLTGDYLDSADVLETALGIYRQVGDQGGEAEALNEAGTLRRTAGHAAEAEGCHRQALELAREIGSTWDEAHALAGLGRCALVAGRAAEAESFLRQSLTIFRGLGAGEAADVAAEVDALGAAGQAEQASGRDER